MSERSGKTSGQEDRGDFMKTVTVRELQKKIKACIDEAQGDRVVTTCRGNPAAVLIGDDGEDWETVMLQTDPTFWRLVHERRKQPTISLSELKARLAQNP
jgi:PHD/YefM family antitoxin component YafN of YafNO toxin-antitoxin module